MVFVWVIYALGFGAYCAVGGLAFAIFGVLVQDVDTNDNPLPIFGSICWPIGLPALIGYVVVREVHRSCSGYLRKRRSLQAQLDEARRKKYEQDAADALKEGYR